MIQTLYLFATILGFLLLFPILGFDATGFNAYQTAGSTFLVISMLQKLWQRWSPSKVKAIPFGYEITKTSLRKTEMINALKSQRQIGSIRPPYPNGWFMLLESDQLKPGEATEVAFMGKNIVAWRTFDRKVYVLDLCCAYVSINEEGNKNNINCKAHGWTFEANDKALNSQTDSDLDDLKSMKIHLTFERNGFVYIWHHAENTSPTWFPMDLPEINNMQYRGGFEHEVNVHVQDIIENEADVNHFNVVHQDGVLLGFGQELTRNFWLRLLDPSVFKWSCEWNQCKEQGQKHMCSMSGATNICVFEKPVLEAFQNIRTEGPALTSARVGPKALGSFIFVVVSVIPIDNVTQRIVERFYFKSWVPSIFSHSFIKFSENLLIKDLTIWNRKKYLNSPCLPKEDSSIKRFRLWYSQFYSEKRFHFN